MTNRERTCELVKIVAKNDIGKPLANDKITYLLDKQTMTVYAPWANCEMLNALGLTIIDLPERSDKEIKEKAKKKSDMDNDILGVRNGTSSMNTCDNCIHCEMCRWINEVERDGCDFWDGNQKEEAIEEIRRAAEGLLRFARTGITLENAADADRYLKTLANAFLHHSWNTAIDSKDSSK